MRKIRTKKGGEDGMYATPIFGWKVLYNSCSHEGDNDQDGR